jgi:serine/threonine protein kinase
MQYAPSLTAHRWLGCRSLSRSYETKSLLESDGMGEVYLARDPRLGRDIAIKVLPAAFPLMRILSGGSSGRRAQPPR